MYLNGIEYLSDKIKDMKEKGITQREIATRLRISGKQGIQDVE